MLMISLADDDGDYKIRPAGWMRLFEDLHHVEASGDEGS